MKQEKKLYNQTEIASKLGVSKGTLSKWINKNNVSPDKTKGNKKLYRETIIIRYNDEKNSQKSNKQKKSSFSTIGFLQNELKRKQETIDKLQDELKRKDNAIVDFGNKFAKLADQAQQLNLTDKDLNKVKQLRNGSGNSAEKSNEKPNSAKKAENQSNNSKPKKHWWQIWK